MAWEWSEWHIEGLKKKGQILHVAPSKIVRYWTFSEVSDLLFVRRRSSILLNLRGMMWHGKRRTATRSVPVTALWCSHVV